MRERESTPGLVWRLELRNSYKEERFAVPTREPLISSKFTTTFRNFMLKYYGRSILYNTRSVFHTNTHTHTNSTKIKILLLFCPHAHGVQQFQVPADRSGGTNLSHS